MVDAGYGGDDKACPVVLAVVAIRGGPRSAPRDWRSMSESKKPPHPTRHNRTSPSRGTRPSGASRAVDPATRIAACETGLAKATADIAALRSTVEAILAE